MDGGRKVWVPHPTEGFTLCRILDIGQNSITVEPLNTPGTTVNTTYESTFPAEEYDKKIYDDNCALMYLNEATLLNNLKLRYTRNQIYTYTAHILIAINPYYEVPELYSDITIRKYQGKSIGVLPPHVYAIADKAYREMKVSKLSQSIIVSGESGAGKTESTKHILRYLMVNWGTHAGPIEQRILESNPLLEAFGNAKTIRNNNSSRFGKFVEIHFDKKNAVCGGFISHYLLEKSRICTQSKDERNYHIFYRLCAGAPETLQQKLYLTSPDQFQYLKRGNTQYFCSRQSEKSLNQSRKSAQHIKQGCLTDPVIDDIRDFRVCDEAMTKMGISDADKMDIYSLVAAVLHLGNITFEEDHEDVKGGCKVVDTAENSLGIAAKLLAVDHEELRDSLISRAMQFKRGAMEEGAIKVPLKSSEAASARDALAKAVYSRLFDYIVESVNQAIPFASSNNYIGILDIAGFEYFQVNSFEQFCINYCNEKLQQFFNERILKEEQLLYEREGLGVKRIEWSDNQDCIELVEAKGVGIFDLLDEESKLPTPKSEHFTMEVHTRNKNHFRLSVPRKFKLKTHRDVRDDEGFIIRHFAGGVCYHTSLFIEKNNDALHASLEFLIQDSENPLLQRLFGDSKTSSGKLTFISVGSKFRKQLGILMEKLKSTGTSFIRCIKPNVTMKDHLFEGASILSQLECAGMVSVLSLMQEGYPSRAIFRDLYDMYAKFLPEKLSALDPRLFCKSLFKALGLDEDDFKFGLTRVFFRPGKFAEFDRILTSDSDNLKDLVEKVMTWLICARWRKSQWCALSVIKLKNKIQYRVQQYVIIQNSIRSWRCVRKFKPKYAMIQKVKSLQTQLDMMGEIVDQLKSDREAAAKRVKELQAAFEAFINKIRKTNITEEEMSRTKAMLSSNIDLQLADLKEKIKQQKIAEEQERLRKIQEMERERKRKEEEEKRKREEEEQRKLEAIRKQEEELRKQKEEEIRRQKEEAIRKKQEEEERKIAEANKAEMAKIAKEQAERQAQVEQERRDRELALRLAHEDQNQVEDISVPPPLSTLSSQERIEQDRRERLLNIQLAMEEESTPSTNLPSRSEVVRAMSQQVSSKKYDLSKWKYADIRNTINTSSDMELLDACHEECRRRLKVYNQWKSKNKKQSAKVDQHVPTAIADEVDRSSLFVVPSATPPKTIDQPQHFFKVPFSNPQVNSGFIKHGMWYAHFDGDWIARQMEICPGNQPVVFLAGVDDFAICELKLSESGLLRKRGAEIKEAEFEEVWRASKGDEYLKKHASKISSKYLRNKEQQKTPSQVAPKWPPSASPSRPEAHSTKL